MSHDLICDWLGLPAGSWPPDHYTLLGIESGRSDDILVEQRVDQMLNEWLEILRGQAQIENFLVPTGPVPGAKQ